MRRVYSHGLEQHVVYASTISDNPISGLLLQIRWDRFYQDYVARFKEAIIKTRWELAYCCL